MKQFEYHVEFYQYVIPAAYILNALGKLGWELVSTQQTIGPIYLYTFKREKSQRNPTWDLNRKYGKLSK